MDPRYRLLGQASVSLAQYLSSIRLSENDVAEHELGENPPVCVDKQPPFAMNDSIQFRLVRVLERCLRLLARLMLRSGIGYVQFAEMAKQAFVEEALGERDTRGRATNLSRVAIRTGISRKEVARIKSNISDRAKQQAVPADDISNYGHAARVLQLWHADSRFLDSKGQPRDLPLGGDGITFSSLVRAAGGDVPPGAVRAELVEAGAVAELYDGRMRPTKRYFVPADVGKDLLVGFTHFVSPLLAGLARNTDRNCSQPFFQRLAFSDRLTASTVPLFRELSNEHSSSFLQTIDDWLSTNESNLDLPASSLHSVGVGVFYYESSATDDGDDQEGAPPEGSVPDV